MARARKRKSLGGLIATLLLLVIVVVIIVGAILEFLVAPKYQNIESKYENRNDVTVATLTGEALSLRPGRAEARAALLVYGYSNESITENVMTTVNISCDKKEGDETKKYLAVVIYFDSIKDAMTALDGVKAKVKENGGIAMVRGKSLVIGSKEAALKYYAVLF